MRSPKKYYSVNWMDGMKISKDHFIAQDCAVLDSLGEVAALNLSPISFGIVPSSSAGEEVFNVKVILDNQNTLRATIHSLQAITPGGFRIGFPGLPSIDDGAGLSGVFPISVTGSATDVYWLVVTILPFELKPSGNPDPSENPPRFPFGQSSYHVQLANESQFFQYAFNPFALIVGKVVVKGDQIRVEEDYIPPCVSTYAHPDLVSLLGELDQFLSGLELRCSQIVQKIFKKSQQNELSELALFLCDRIMLFLGQSITEMRWSQLYDSPAKMLMTIVSLARVMKNTIDLRTGTGKEELMNYLSEWCELNQGELEQMLVGMANLRYNHNDINSNIVSIIHFVKIIGKLFESLSNLEFIGKRKESGIFVKEEHNYNQQGNNAGVEQPKPRRRFFG